MSTNCSVKWFCQFSPKKSLTHIKLRFSLPITLPKKTSFNHHPHDHIKTWSKALNLWARQKNNFTYLRNASQNGHLELFETETRRFLRSRCWRGGSSADSWASSVPPASFHARRKKPTASEANRWMIAKVWKKKLYKVRTFWPKTFNPLSHWISLIYEW